MAVSNRTTPNMNTDLEESRNVTPGLSDASRQPSRRQFLAMAASGAALPLTNWVERRANAMGVGRALSPNEAQPLETGGITPENFENARKRAAAIVEKLTLEEKISQFGAGAPAVDRLGLPAFDYGAGEALHGMIHIGPITAFPVPLALGCSWNRSLMYRVFDAVSDEVWAAHKKDRRGLALFSPPTVDLGARDPRWGRIAENYGEDPYLVAQLAIPTVQGMQGDNPRYLKTIACAKHYIANDTDTDRHMISASVDARSFWEYYSPAFEAVVRQGQIFAVMSSYNELNGIPTTASPFLLTDLLRNRWGFRGYVVSDCGAVSDIYQSYRPEAHQYQGHHFVNNYAEAAALAVNAGCDINCGQSQILQKYLGEAVQKMLISESTLDRSLVRSFTSRILLGEYDPPEQNPYSKIPVSCLESPAHRHLAREAARQSIVLFKNENGALPLDKNKLKKIAVIGPMAGTNYLGNYSGTPWLRISPLQGIKEYLGIPAAPAYKKFASDFSCVGPSAKKQTFWRGQGPLLETCNESGLALGSISDGTWAGFANVLLTGATEFHARVASNSAGGSIEVRLESLTGPLLSTLQVPNSGGEQKWVDIAAPIKPTTGEHKLFLCFGGSPERSFSLQSFKLTPETRASLPASGAAEVTYAMGCTVTGDKDPDQFDAAVQAAKEADVALVFVGTDEQVDREGHDRDYIHLPGAQHDLVQAVYSANPKTILIVSSNAPVALNWEQDHLPAIVGGLLLGEQQGNALAEVLFGDYNPSGKLTTTWYREIEDLPDFHDYNIRHGRTYMYFKGNPLYPFGHGLHYTEFEYKNLEISSHTLSAGSKVTISLEVANTGSCDGDEIVQLYVHLVNANVERPLKQLVGFERVHVKVGERQRITFNLDHEDRALRYWDDEKYDFVLEPCQLDVMAGASSEDIRLKARISLV